MMGRHSTVYRAGKIVHDAHPTFKLGIDPRVYPQHYLIFVTSPDRETAGMAIFYEWTCIETVNGERCESSDGA